MLAEEIHSRTPMRITLDSSLDRDAGLDSLARMELLARLESQFGIALPERVFADAETPRDLLRSARSPVSEEEMWRFSAAPTPDRERSGWWSLPRLGKRKRHGAMPCAPK
ncbi:MAG: acyl carrier protein [Syntrophaceae bacterium]